MYHYISLYDTEVLNTSFPIYAVCSLACRHLICDFVVICCYLIVKIASSVLWIIVRAGFNSF